MLPCQSRPATARCGGQGAPLTAVW